ncbi:uncharacterized protein LOC135806764 [Sycon ciliatum]|uniref:uncharacterized protein LOC135806764 n=1 Tax=Sycon ciliatum TaxID=27933 RepID=UPI0031F685D4
MPVNGLNPATDAASMIKVEPGMGMLRSPGNVVDAGAGSAGAGSAGAGSAGATSLLGIPNHGLHNGSAVSSSLPNHVMLPSGGNHIGSASRGSGINGGNPGLLPNAGLPTGHVGAGNMQQPGAHPTANNEYIKQILSSVKVHPRAPMKRWTFPDPLRLRVIIAAFEKMVRTCPSIQPWQYKGIGQACSCLEAKFYSEAKDREEYLQSLHDKVVALIKTSGAEFQTQPHHQQQQQQYQQQYQQQQQHRNQEQPKQQQQLLRQPHHQQLQQQQQQQQLQQQENGGQVRRLGLYETMNHWSNCTDLVCPFCSLQRAAIPADIPTGVNSTPGMPVNGLNPATDAASMIKVEPGMGMLRSPGNVVDAGAGSAGATSLLGIPNHGLHNGSAVSSSLPNHVMLPSGGNHIGSAPRGSGINGGNPGLLPNAGLPTGHVGAGNMQQPGARPTANNEYMKQILSSVKVHPRAPIKRWTFPDPLRLRVISAVFEKMVRSRPSIQPWQYKGIGQACSCLEAKCYSQARNREEYLQSVLEKVVALIKTSGAEFQTQPHQQQQQQYQQQQQHRHQEQPKQQQQLPHQQLPHQQLPHQQQQQQQQHQLPRQPHQQHQQPHQEQHQQPHQEQHQQPHQEQHQQPHQEQHQQPHQEQQQQQQQQQQQLQQQENGGQVRRLGLYETMNHWSNCTDLVCPPPCSLQRAAIPAAEQATGMLPLPGNNVSAGAGSAGATPLPRIPNLGLRNGSAVRSSSPNNGMLPFDGNHIGSATSRFGIRGGSTGMFPNAGLPTGHVGAGNMQQASAHPMSNNDHSLTLR